MTFFSKNLHYIKVFSEMFYHIFSTKTNPRGASIHRKKDLFPLMPPLVTILKALEKPADYLILCRVNNESRFKSTWGKGFFQKSAAHNSSKFTFTNDFIQHQITACDFPFFLNLMIIAVNFKIAIVWRRSVDGRIGSQFVSIVG